MNIGDFLDIRASVVERDLNFWWTNYGSLTRGDGISLPRSCSVNRALGDQRFRVQVLHAACASMQQDSTLPPSKDPARLTPILVQVPIQNAAHSTAIMVSSNRLCRPTCLFLVLTYPSARTDSTAPVRPDRRGGSGQYRSRSAVRASPLYTDLLVCLQAGKLIQQA